MLERIAALLFFAFAASVTAQQSPINPKIEKDLTVLRGWDRGDADEQNPMGLRMVFTQFTELKNEGKTLRNYRVYVQGAPVNKEYSLAMWQVARDPQPLIPTLYVNEAGLLMIHKPKPEQMKATSVDEVDEIDLALGGAKGEPQRFMLTAKDGSLTVFGTVVPFPIEVTDKQCSARLLLGTPDAGVVLIEASGFAPNSKVHTVSISEGDRTEDDVMTEGKGRLFMVQLPAVDGKSSGQVDVMLTNGKCTLRLSAPWGKNSYKAM